MQGKLTVTLNYAATGLRREKLQGKEYLVVPTVMITEGVHNGSIGPLYYAVDTLSKNPESWNHKPVVVYHPDDNLTATRVENLEKSCVGLIMNATWDSHKNKLRCEAWIEESRVKKIDDRVMSAIHAGALMEVSTGLFSDCISNSGTWNGEDYVAEVVNIVPDHLAILPDLKGACSIRDGAGLFQLNSEKGEDGLWDMLSKAVSKGIESSKLVAVLNGEIVYEVDGNHFAAPFDHDSEKSQVTVNVKNQREVLKLTGFAPLLTHKESDESPHNEETKMKKSELVDGLISNESTQFGESDREFLEGLKEDQLSKLAPVIDNEEEEEEEVEVEEEEDAEEEVIENVETVEDWISQSKCPAPIANVIRESLQNQDKTRKALVSTIVNSEHSKLTEEDLSAFSIDHLTKISESLVVENKEDETHQSYEGQQGVVANSLCLNAEEVAALGEPLGIPQMTQPKAD